jgi:hypothetical protein
MRSIITFLMLALVGTASQAAVERFPLDNPAACVMAYTQLYVDGAKNGWERKTSEGREVFIKDGYVGYFSHYAVDGSNCVLQSETLAEFQQRVTPREIPRNPSRESPEVSFWDTGWGTVVKVVGTGILIAAVMKAFPATGALGACDYTWQTAKDGSRCGNRAAIVRPGGKF